MGMTSVAVTGVSGRTGQRLLSLLERDARVERIVGLDVHEPSFRPRRLEFHAVDVGGADLKPLLEGVDVLVHLAALLEPLPDEEVMARVNVDGTRRVLDAAAATGVGKVVHVSSAFAYGAWPGNPTPLTEDAPLRPNQAFSFAVHKAETERMLAEWHDEHPGVVTTVLRPPFVLGGGTPPPVRALVRGRLPVRVRDAAPDVQYLHVDDLAAAVAFAVFEDLPGAHNVAPDGWLSHEEAAALAGWVPRITVSADVADRMVRRLWQAGVGDVPPGMVPLLVHPCVVANDRLKAAGWRPRHTNEEALLACVDEEGGAGGRKGLAVAAAAAVIGSVLAVAGAVAWTVLRKQRGGTSRSRRPSRR